MSWARVPLVVASWLLVLGVWSARPVMGQLRESFESPQPTWQLAEADCGVKVLAHDRTYRDSHSGNGSEHLRLALGNGTFVHLSYRIGKVPLIAEFEPKIWLKSDKANLQWMVRVVFPRSVDNATGQPITSLLRGESYTDVGAWQQLQLRDAERLLARNLIALRTQFGREIDRREAYVDMVVINAFSTPGNVDLWIDDLEVAGYVNLDDAAAQNNAADAAGSMASGAALGTGNKAAAALPTPPTLQGPLLLVDSRPMMPRVIESNDEPLEWLASLGFNTVKLRRPPTLKEMKEAQRLGIWLVAPPPKQEELTTLVGNSSRMLGWSLGDHLTTRDLTIASKTANDLRRQEPSATRPLVIGADVDLENYSRLGGILKLDRPVLATSFELADQRQWLLDRQRLLRPGTPTWAVVSTHLPVVMHDQLQVFSRGRIPPAVAIMGDADWLQQRQLVLSSIAAGARGLVFASQFPVQNDTNAAIHRANVLRMINAELSVVEPWVAGGSLVEEVASGDPAVRVSMLQTERSRLLVVQRESPAQQYVASAADKQPLALVVPGVPISDRAYQVTFAGLQQLRTSQGNGGIRILVEDALPGALIVVTQDPLVIHHLNRTLAAIRGDAARLRMEMASYRLLAASDTDTQLTELGKILSPARQWLPQAQSQLDTARKLLSGNDFRGVHAALSEAEMFTARVERGHWEQSVSAFTSPAASPFISQYTTLPMHWQFAERIQRSGWGPNGLAAGDMEDLGELLRNGWKQERNLPAGTRADVSLSLQSPHTGRSALRLLAQSDAPDRHTAVFQRPLVSIRSSGIPAGMGQIARIHGFVYVPKPLLGTQDGLMIFDSLTGPDLAQRVRFTQGWREFTLYRAIPRNGEFAVTFALTGLGEAWIDDVSISLMNTDPIRESTPDPMLAAPGSAGPPASSSATRPIAAPR